jgi:hypothetical protein
MKNRLKKGLVVISIVAPLVLGCAGMAQAAEKVIEVKKEYRTSIKDEDGKSQFDEFYEKDGLKYRLKAIRIDNIEEIYPGDIITYDSPPFVGDPKEYEPKESVNKEGKNYTLTKSELKSITTNEIKKYSETSIFYKGVEYIDPLPEDVEVDVENKDLDQKIKVRLPSINYKDEGTYWDYNFTFPVAVTGYDADSYMLGETEIPSNSPLIDHSEQLLSYLNLPSEYYEVTSIEWTGEPVYKDGDMIRNAIAHGRKLVKDIKGIYGGDVTFPSVRANVYHGVYIQSEAENQTFQIIYKKDATATYERVGMGFWDFLKWLLSNPITVAILLLLLLIAVILIVLLKRSMKRKKKKPIIEEEEDEEI